MVTKEDEAYIVLTIASGLKALIALLEKKGIVTQKEVEELQIKLIKEGIKK